MIMVPATVEACGKGGLRRVVGIVLSVVLFSSGPVLAGPEEDQLARGRELFTRQWRPNDPRSHGGDGLGPVYNEASCVACHSQGGPGGAGPVAKNAELLTLVGWSATPRRLPGLNRVLVTALVPQALRSVEQQNDVLATKRSLHPGLEEAPTVVLHRFGTSPDYGRWRSELMTQVTAVNLLALPRALVEYHANIDRIKQAREAAHRARRVGFRSVHVPNLPQDPMRRVQGPNVGDLALAGRNTPPLFGAGLIDAIDAADIQAGSLFQDPHIRGRVARLKDGRIGRFGWKAQLASLDDFVLTACANELGLEVPGHHQAVSPQAPSVQPSGLDMIEAECNDLIAYVRSLPQPVALDSPHPAQASQGESIFDSIGCAGCHTPKLGKVKGIYSDLLLHTMGEELSDDGVYYGSSSSSSSAGSQDWRTPPLWGLRTSGPFLHDGRATSVAEAVAFHGGQGEESRRKFFALEGYERRDLLEFLDTLSAPVAEVSADPQGENNGVAQATPPSLLPQPKVHGKLRAAQELEGMGKIDAALDFYCEIVRLAPSSPDARKAAQRIAALKRGQLARSN